MLGDKLETVSDFHPERCQGGNVKGQCYNRVSPGSKFCPSHSTALGTTIAKAAANAYRLQIYQSRMTEFTTNDEIKNLRAEIGILRMVLEQVINSCGADINSIAAFSGKIADLVIKIRTLVVTCQKLETQLGKMLDQDRVIILGQTIVEIVTKYIEDPDILESIGKELVQAILKITNQPI